MSALGNTSILRSLLILIILIVTILIYGLYSIAPELSIPKKITEEVVRQKQEQINFHQEVLPAIVGMNNTGEFGLSFDGEKQNLLKNPPLNSLKDLQTPNFGGYFIEQHFNTNTVTTLKPNDKTTSNVILEFKASPNPTIITERLYESGHLNVEINVDRICPLSGLFKKLLILITSALEHADERLSIRQTWGHYGSRRDIGIAFVLGQGIDQKLNKALNEENSLYGDLIRGNFIDTYGNMTLKVISALEWADQYCHRVKYILKTDDDMFINVPKLLKFVRQLEKRKEKRSIFGSLAKNWKPVRNSKSKYYVSIDQYSAKLYPCFTTGPAYLMTGDIVHDLYVQSLKTSYLKLEDVLITGIVAEKLGIERFHVSEFFNRRIQLTVCNTRKFISLHMIKASEQFGLWEMLHNQFIKC